MSFVILRVAKEFSVVKFLITKAGKARIERCQKNKCCCACEKAFNKTDVLFYVCGVCRTCYNAAQRAIRENRTTKEQLVREGKMLPPKSGRHASNDFVASLSRKPETA